MSNLIIVSNSSLALLRLWSTEIKIIQCMYNVRVRKYSKVQSRVQSTQREHYVNSAGVVNFIKKDLLQDNNSN